jgi:hypothetical protein
MRYENNGRKGTVSFALTILQRRLASPEAIYQSIHRRRERLQKRLQEEEAEARIGCPTKFWTGDNLRLASSHRPRRLGRRF